MLKIFGFKNVIVVVKGDNIKIRVDKTNFVTFYKDDRGLHVDIKSKSREYEDLLIEIGYFLMDDLRKEKMRIALYNFFQRQGNVREYVLSKTEGVMFSLKWRLIFGIKVKVKSGIPFFNPAALVKKVINIVISLRPKNQQAMPCIRALEHMAKCA